MNKILFLKSVTSLQTRFINCKLLYPVYRIFKKLRKRHENIDKKPNNNVLVDLTANFRISSIVFSVSKYETRINIQILAHSRKQPIFFFSIFGVNKFFLKLKKFYS